MNAGVHSESFAQEVQMYTTTKLCELKRCGYILARLEDSCVQLQDLSCCRSLLTSMFWAFTFLVSSGNPRDVQGISAPPRRLGRQWLKNELFIAWHGYLHAHFTDVCPSKCKRIPGTHSVCISDYPALRTRANAFRRRCSDGECHDQQRQSLNCSPCCSKVDETVN
ncbi:hypothetical protein EJ08DRAFT_153776 [Tothia fuscella]|uniref:Uncharacterized protein n=1 Tax=Tothia fuscella TaxID=1048955 RepID=A0A9P4U455_9PEZI|nr:hypothetical protein EJ08DRAFT_153776 [Tothia fuscella]